MKIENSILLAPYTTFKIGGKAKYFCIVKSESEAKEAYEFAKKEKLQVFVLGGGSNVLVNDKGFNGLVVKIENRGTDIVEENDDSVTFKIASGENWDKVVKLAVDNNWWGIENLSHIPGNTGAIAVQNVGAYGQEAKNVIKSVSVFNSQTGSVENLQAQDCGFGYRQSIFNTTQKGKFIIFSVFLVLQKKAMPNLSYRDLKTKFQDRTPKLNEIRQAVIEIRNKKFPFPVEAKNGNAGSFFKNPVLSPLQYEQLESTLAIDFGNEALNDLRSKVNITDSETVKVPAAFLIDLCELKDLKFGGAAINHGQPLVIINQTGTATSNDVLNLANQVKHTVKGKTGIELVFEPELIGF